MKIYEFGVIVVIIVIAMMTVLLLVYKAMKTLANLYGGYLVRKENEECKDEKER